jgi:hypothetical protein
MGGKYSRDKGARNERLVRDYFRGLGLVCDRVPLSGASQGFKGDLRVALPSGQVLYPEIKARKQEFKTVYELLGKANARAFDFGGQLVLLSREFAGLGYLYPVTPVFFPEPVPPKSRGGRKLLGLKKLLKGCDFLVIKDDRQQPLFIRYY